MIKKIGVRNSLIYILILLIIYFTFIFRIPVNTRVAQYTSYDDKISFRGIYFGNEYIISNQPINSLGKLSVENGARVSMGTKISNSIISGNVGILLYGVDGYENKYDVQSVKSLSLVEMDKMINKEHINTGLKVVESESVYLYVFIEKDGSFQKGQKFYITIDDIKYLSKVTDIISRKEGNFLVLNLMEDIDYKNLHRGVRGYIIKSSHEGILLDSSSIKVNGDKYSVLVKMPNGYVGRKEVDVTYDDGEYAVVVPKGSNTIQQYDEVIVNPSRILKEGLKVK